MEKAFKAAGDMLMKPETWIAGIAVGFVVSKLERGTREKVGFKQVHGILDQGVSALTGVFPNAK